MSLLDAAIIAIVTNNQQALADQADHPLKGAYKEDRELHIGGTGDWLLRYNIDEARITLLLLATGTHREVLGVE